MYTVFTALLDRLSSSSAEAANIIEWSCPVPFFGDPAQARVATLGLNPSNREFVDESGDELSSDSRRLHTLASLELDNWEEADYRHIGQIVIACSGYFKRNSYDRWFKRLDAIVAGANASYYDQEASACHIDLAPFATKKKWAELDASRQRALVDLGGDMLANVLYESGIGVLILNGQSVVDLFQKVAATRLLREQMPKWKLLRNPPTPDVFGFSYSGTVEAIRDLELRRPLLVLGYNHNIQSSFGVTSVVVQEIRAWVEQKCRERI